LPSGRAASPAGLLLLVLLVAPGARGQSPPADSVRYRVTDASRFDVLTRRTGLFGFAGHDHLVRAGALAGEIVDVPADPARSRVRIVIPAAALRVLTAADSSDLPKINQAMREQVLLVDRFPEITFASTAVAAAGETLRVTGDLTLVGVARSIAVDVTLRRSGDTLRAAGRFAVRQRAFGIKPYSTALGTVKVADEITFDFDAVAVREGSLDPASEGQHLPDRSNPDHEPF
jgi:polyisoprenoid-binding protein YceI